MSEPIAPFGMARCVRRVHMVGVGGTGMSGIAEVLVKLGFEVGGTDLRDSETTRYLSSVGVDVRLGHRKEHLGEADVVVASTAIPADNPEIAEARRRGTPVVRRAAMLKELMRGRLSVAVAGAHGKTTTTAMVGSILVQAGRDPTIVVGGKVNAVGSHARFGEGPTVVVEADESDGSFVDLDFEVAVITNIDLEHLDHYTGGLEAIRAAFLAFLRKRPFYGLAVLCLDDPEVQALLPKVEGRRVTYGLSPEAQLRATDLRFEGSSTSFEVFDTRGSRGRYALRMLGPHNVRNALAALAVADELGVCAEAARAGLEAFEGVDRRFSVRGEVDGVLVVDDYGHHPAEIEATLRGVRYAHPGRRVIAVFQPHRYTRTAHLLDALGAAFGDADVVFVLPIYAAGEPRIEGVDAHAVLEALGRHGQPEARALSGLPSAVETLVETVRPGDLLIAFGAGDIGQLGVNVVRALSARKMTDGS